MHIYTHIYMHIHISRRDNSPFVQDLASHLFGNPHSQHGWSGNEGSAQAVAEARQLTLQMCNAPLGEYECVFTSGATGALHSADHSPNIAIMLIRILSHERFESWSEFLLTVGFKNASKVQFNLLQILLVYQVHSIGETHSLQHAISLSSSCRGIEISYRSPHLARRLTVPMFRALKLLAEAFPQ
jgi:hypothetical protein